MNFFKSNHKRKSIAVAVLVMASAFAHHANARALGKVDVIGSYTGTQLTSANAWKATWNNAWNQCRAQYGQTRSVNMTWYQFGEPNQPNSNARSVAATWECRDTTN
ncbi:MULTISPECIES: hypothetical protein [Ralstonia solanacearum species complex]|uniref:hypothetical protein n=1 Tax=Ralstonia solanacearum species complex TaxID=3116862 RepID=UPI000E57FF8D|nr:hypothetical protein [Ralstonia solanacearum]BEU74905.1 hypothetical protein MAFF211271_44600 [Ralstonia pseudosolanacearum]AXV79709.1 hypothetical protein CJO76_22740 [Ralstonia solanacearum]AXV93736.1 hypothetical protein CJO79_22720 [Ralstonia solanacearum]AXW21736.1 hypothetical protein CJO85_22840 [Ralstonia solanacearum]AXW78631.1 hypothetical protein CJO97_22720 [Ralstonia solanacearum]